MKITDGYKTVDITMKVWDKQNNEWKFAGENLANDFFEVAALPMSNEGTYIVKDVDYCVEEANDWAECLGNHYDEERDDEERSLTVEDKTVSAEDIACVLRHSGEWIERLCETLCEMADMRDEWNAIDTESDAESFERTVEAAADKLGVKLYSWM